MVVKLLVTSLSHSLPPHGCPWNSPGKNNGVGCHSLLQGIFLTQGSNLGLLHCRQILYHLSHQGSPELVGFSNWLRRRQWHPTPVLLPGKSHGWRSLVGYSLWVCKESDMTEPLTLSLPFVTNFTSQIFFKSIALSPLPTARAVISFLGYFSSLWTHLLHPEVPPRLTPSPRESPSSAWSEVSVKFAK